MRKQLEKAFSYPHSIFWHLSGIIEDVGKADEIAAKYASRHDNFAEIIDCSGMSVLPGLVDGHTHPVFAGDRVHEFAMKVKALAEKLAVHFTHNSNAWMSDLSG